MVKDQLYWREPHPEDPFYWVPPTEEAASPPTPAAAPPAPAKKRGRGKR